MPRLPAWLAATAARLARRPARPVRRLALESLEARDVPAAYTWLPTAPGAYSWNDPANWTGGPAGTFPNAAADTADLTAAITGNQVVTLGSAVTVAAVTVGSGGAGTGAYTIAGNGNTLTFDAGGGTAALTAAAGSDGDAVLADITLASSLTVTNTAAAALALFGGVGGTGTLTVTGTGPVAAPNGLDLPATVGLAGTGTITSPAVLYAASFFDAALYAFDADTGATLATIVAPYATGGLLTGPAGLTVGPDGNLYIANQGSATNPIESVLKYDLTTLTLSTFISTAQLDAARTGTANTNTTFSPAGLAFDPNDANELYVVLNGGQNSAGGGSVVRFDLTGGAYVGGAGTFHPLVTNFYQPSGLTFGRGTDNTSLYVTSAVPIVVGTDVVGFNGRITKVASAGSNPVASELITPGAGGLAYPSGLAFGPDGKLYVADLAALEQLLPPGAETGKVVRFDADGSNPVQFNQGGAGAGSLSQQFPSGVIFDAAGNLLTGNLGPARPPAQQGSVYRYNPDGTLNAIVVSSSQFPNTGQTQGGQQESGVTTSQIALNVGSPPTTTGSVSPGGAAAGTLTVPGLTFAAGSALLADVGAGGDRLASTGPVDLTGSPALTITPGTTTVGTTYTVLTAPAGTITGTFAGLPDGTVFTAGGQQFRINYTAAAVTLTRVQGPTINNAVATATFFTGQPVNFAVTVAAGAFPAPTFAVTNGALPAGLTLDMNTGVITGTPTTAAPAAAVEITASSAAGGDPETFTFTVLTGSAPAITSANTVTFTVGTAGSFTVTTTGTPTAAIMASTLPAGLTLTDNGDGTATVAGTPTGTGGVTTVTLTAANGITPDSTQMLSITVNAAPVFTGATTATFTVGTAGPAFPVTTTGFPAAAITSSPLPGGLTLTDNGDGTATIAGTPTGTGGTFPITLTATNSVSAVMQTLTITVNAAPTFTSANTATFTVGTAATFTVTTTGFPTTTIMQTGTLPPGMTFTDNGDGTATLTGTPTGTGGTFPLTLTASNGIGTDATQTLTITVNAAPVFTGATTATFSVGTAGSFTVTTTGFPAAATTRTGTLPPGVTFTDNGNGTATIAGTPTGTGGTFPITLTATNSVSAVMQTLTITVNAAPTFTSPTTATFTAGTNGTFTITTAGNPAITAIMQGGALPPGLTFTDNGNGTATIAGTPTGAGGTFPVTLTATNGIAPDGVQTLTLTVATTPVFTSAAATAFAAEQFGTFTITAAGFPAPTFAFTAGTLPPGITLSPTGVLSGTTAAGAAGTYPITVTATNAAGSVNQSFTLTVGTAPAITSAGSATFDVGTGGTFTVTATGSPATTLAQTAALPAGVTFDAATGVLTVGTTAAAGTTMLTFTATNTLGTATQTFTLVVGADLSPRLTIGGAPGGGTPVFDPNAAGQYPAAPTATVNPFAGTGVVTRSATGDVNGDGIADTIVVTGPGTPIRFAVVSGADNTTLLVPPTAPFAGSEGFTGGGFVSSGDLDGDGRAEVVVSPDQGGGPRVTIFSLVGGDALAVRANFLGIDDASFRGGARTAVGDVNGDGRPDVAVAAGFLGGPRVALFDGATLLTSPTRLVNDFFAFPGTDAQNLRNGAFVALGDVTGDGFADLVFGGGPGGAPRVFVLSGALVSAGNVAGAQASTVANFFVGNDTADRGGARVGVVDADGDGRADIAVGSGAGAPARVRVYLAPTITPAGEPTPFQDLTPFGGAVLLDGVYVG
ncbi:VCBS repeat-containing protein [bacterium]|nr:VCBS repeat-containing protein [bacterium]